MKKFLSLLIITASLMAGNARAATAGEIVFVDLQEIFKGYYKSQLAQDQIAQQKADIKLEREAMEDEVKQMEEKVETLRADSREEALSEEVRDNKRDLLEEKLVELQKRVVEITEYEKLRIDQLKQQEGRMSRKLYDEILDGVNRYAKGKDYGAVIDRSAKSRAGTHSILYVSLKKDITAEVLLILNEGQEKTVTEETPIINTEQ